MDHLDEIPIEELQRALDDVEGAKPTQRLLAAIAYKNGVTQTELAEWYGVERKTIYSWLKRLESGSIERAVVDDQRSGRPRKLSKELHERLEQTLHEPPTEVGYDTSAWTPELVRDYLAEMHDVQYSIPSCRRLMKEAGLSYGKTGQPAAEGHSSEENADRGDRSKRRGRWTP